MRFSQSRKKLKTFVETTPTTASPPGLWTKDMTLAHRAAREIHAGLVWINGWDSCAITMPFGGFKQSGFGRARSLHALHKYADLKSVSITL